MRGDVRHKERRLPKRGEKQLFDYGATVLLIVFGGWEGQIVEPYPDASTHHEHFCQLAKPRALLAVSTEVIPAIAHED